MDSNRSSAQSNPQPLQALSQEFLAVVSRIENRLMSRLAAKENGLKVSLETAQLERITAAEAKVDTCAAGLQSGRILPEDWRAALSDYESAWLQVVDRLGERRN